MDPSVRETLLKDARVQAEIKKAGENALNDPQVQQMIVDTCKEKFPQYAAQAQSQISTWAADPAVQAQAKEYANKALTIATTGVATAGSQFIGKIEQGPAGVRVLAFLGSIVSMVLSVMGLINILEVVSHPVTYIVCVYQFIFAFTTALFEIPPDYVTKIQSTVKLPVDKYQTMLIENAKFLSLNGGRGCFYIFQGTLWLALAGLAELLKYAIGAYMCFMGFLHILMHYGVLPQEIAQKMRSGYQQVAGAPNSPREPHVHSFERAAPGSV
eukprot:TRINITY_DN77728_c0_g1_i1.p1 TRINITY_DN77728_c0_g1~~TRINITY_DN77728_c0_g1_i1.p1  ORF type:complete len:270 (+),score=62.77 TRINITY_DN77728_c0_g1_i1:98-907(+)